MAVDTRPLANMNVLNVGSTLGDVEQYKGLKMRNELLGYQTADAKAIAERREERRRIEELYASLPARIREYKRLGMHEEAQQGIDFMLKTKEQELRMLDLAAQTVTAENWKPIRAGMIEAGAIDGSQMPTEYSREWIESRLATAKGEMKELEIEYGVTDPDSGETRTMKESRLYQDGEEVERFEPFETEASKRARGAHKGGTDGKPWEMNSGDSNAIRNASAEQFDGFYDPVTGEFKGLMGEEKRKALQLAERAAQLFRESQGRLSHNEAVAQAAREQGLKVKSTRLAPDPLGVR